MKRIVQERLNNLAQLKYLSRWIVFGADLVTAVSVSLFTIILLFQMQRSLRERDAYEAEVARQNAEQLRSSLDQKVTLSMSVVSDRLQQVSRSLGTLQSLSQNVGDLKKVMGNVKNRGIWGEMQFRRRSNRCWRN